MRALKPVQPIIQGSQAANASRQCLASPLHVRWRSEGFAIGCRSHHNFPRNIGRRFLPYKVMNLFLGRVLGRRRVQPEPVARSLTHRPCVSDHRHIVVNAWCAWAPAVNKLGVQKILNTLQRNVALKVCRAYRIVSLSSALIFPRLLLFNRRVRLAACLYEIKRGKQLKYICAEHEFERPVGFCKLPHLSHILELRFKCVEDLGPTIIDRLSIV
ncbi:hypothetical protein EVAR_38833_1 [Eumeta japonica]|uniref:Uncharacterized protein n=1 Tax=Eumeta variegata TaxID=151549 RepID=A0A4C1XSH6_EUMVA|nr:hypothetical protein EVAR_38833_1 [Eumeta japonica]